MAKKTSINDIASHFKIAKSTVSFIINGKAEQHRISAALAEKVLAYVEEINYKPHPFAKGLATGKTNNIALVVENIGDSFFGQIAYLLEEKADQKGMKISYSSTRGDSATAQAIINLYKERKVDGCILAVPEGVDQAVAELIEQEIPVVLFDRKLDKLRADYVGTDNERVSVEACRHLIAQGFRHIAFITLNSGQSQMSERMEGYRKSMKEAHLNTAILELPYGNTSEKNGNLIRSFLENEPKTDAVFVATNYLCIHLLEVLKELDKSIPDDLAVLVFDDIDLFRLYNPPITAIAQPLKQISEQVIQLLLDKIDGKRKPEEIAEITVPSELIIRASTKK